jgi:hypothetical protein
MVSDRSRPSSVYTKDPRGFLRALAVRLCDVLERFTIGECVHPSVWVTLVPRCQGSEVVVSLLLMVSDWFLWHLCSARPALGLCGELQAFCLAAATFCYKNPRANSADSNAVLTMVGALVGVLEVRELALGGRRSKLHASRQICLMTA